MHMFDPFILSFFCIVYHHFVHFYACFYLLDDVRVKGSKNEQIRVKKADFGLSRRACRSMLAKFQIEACRSMT